MAKYAPLEPLYVTEETRATIKNLIFQAFEYDKNGRQIAESAEKGCYDAALALESTPGTAQTERYSEIVYRVLFNICPGNSGPTLNNRVAAGEVDPYRLAFLKSEELNPAALADIREKIDCRRGQTINKTVSAMYTCRKCGKKETCVMTYQARSADEGSTTSIQCLNETCGNIWRM